jgi:hypothetical protein
MSHSTKHHDLLCLPGVQDSLCNVESVSYRLSSLAELHCEKNVAVASDNYSEREGKDFLHTCIARD